MLEEPEINIYELDNGLKVGTTKFGIGIVHGQIDVRFGFMDEGENEKGLSHLVEHLNLFSGTEGQTHAEANEELGMFPSFNAETNVNNTSYFGATLSDKVVPFVSLLSKKVFNPIYTQELLNIQKDIVSAEIAQKKASAAYENSELFDRKIFREHPRARADVGEPEKIRSTTIEQAKKMHKKSHVPANSNLIFTGDLPKNIDSLIEENFSEFESGKRNKREKIILQPFENAEIYTTAATYLKSENSNEGILNFVYVLPKVSKVDNIYLNMLTHLLGGSVNSRLFKKLRNELGLTYDVRTGSDNNSGASTLGISLHTNLANTNKVIDVINSELLNLSEEKISDNELSKYLTDFSFSVLSSFNTLNGRGAYLLEKMNGRDTALDRYRKANEMTKEDVLNFAQQHLKPVICKYLLWIQDPNA